MSSLTPHTVSSTLTASYFPSENKYPVGGKGVSRRTGCISFGDKNQTSSELCFSFLGLICRTCTRLIHSCMQQISFNFRLEFNLGIQFVLNRIAWNLVASRANIGGGKSSRRDVTANFPAWILSLWLMDALWLIKPAHLGSWIHAAAASRSLSWKTGMWELYAQMFMLSLFVCVLCTTGDEFCKRRFNLLSAKKGLLLIRINEISRLSMFDLIWRTHCISYNHQLLNISQIEIYIYSFCLPLRNTIVYLVSLTVSSSKRTNTWRCIHW